MSYVTYILHTLYGITFLSSGCVRFPDHLQELSAKVVEQEQKLRKGNEEKGSERKGGT